MECNFGTTERIRTKIRGSRLRGSQSVLFFVTSTTRPSGHLFCADFDRVWNNRHESMCRAVHPWKISEFLHRGFASPKKLPRARYFGWGACYQRTAQAAQFRAIEIVSGAVDNCQGCAFCMWVLMEDVHSGVAMGWAGWSKSRGPECRGPKFQTKN